MAYAAAWRGWCRAISSRPGRSSRSTALTTRGPMWFSIRHRRQRRGRATGEGIERRSDAERQDALRESEQPGQPVSWPGGAYAATTRTASRSVVHLEGPSRGHVWKPSFALNTRVSAGSVFHIKPRPRGSRIC